MSSTPLFRINEPIYALHCGTIEFPNAFNLFLCNPLEDPLTILQIVGLGAVVLSNPFGMVQILLTVPGFFVDILIRCQLLLPDVQSVLVAIRKNLSLRWGAPNCAAVIQHHSALYRILANDRNTSGSPRLMIFGTFSIMKIFGLRTRMMFHICQ